MAKKQQRRRPRPPAARPLERPQETPATGPFGHLYTEAATLERIAARVAQLAELEADNRADVGYLREHGVDWATIGRALGTTGQAAGRRFRG